MSGAGNCDASTMRPEGTIDKNRTCFLPTIAPYGSIPSIILLSELSLCLILQLVASSSKLLSNCFAENLFGGCGMFQVEVKCTANIPDEVMSLGCK